MKLTKIKNVFAIGTILICGFLMLNSCTSEDPSPVSKQTQDVGDIDRTSDW